jgi:NADH dehydrogenase/NADH:ubiquinone oxidoreductase subunit G
MIEIELDGKKVEVVEGSMVMHAAEKAGTFIPHFCYHKKLSIAANCRMCLVDVEKAPKPMPACATPVTQGMVVRTKSEKAVKAQQSVMEFLLINHPLDCPICDQGGECQLQDLAVGYGGSSSRYQEEKRVVFHKDVGPLISMEEMSRCIHCTRCVRFGQEVAGVMELGMSHRGEHAEIETFVGQTVDSELSGNMIDLCPVGALTSKPFRYSARTWELSRRKSVSPHDSTGANLIVQVKGNRVLRVVPFENEAVNECWIADRDRFSYEALNSDERLTTPMLKQGGQWTAVDWQTALEYVANGLKQVKGQHGPASIGLLASPHSTLEELHLAGALVKGLGSPNLDARLRYAEFAPMKVCVIWAHRLPRCLNCSACWWWVRICARITRCSRKEFVRPCARGVPSVRSRTGLWIGRCRWPTHYWPMHPFGCKRWQVSPPRLPRKRASKRRFQGRSLMKRAPSPVRCWAASARRFSAAGPKARSALSAADMVVSLSPFKANMDFADVVLPIAPFTETSGSFVNAEARLQSFHAVVQPFGETRPAWKVLRVLANLLDLPDFGFESSQDVLRAVAGVQVSPQGAVVAANCLSNETSATVDLAPAQGQPVTAAIYQLDGLVRRSASLQLTADARRDADLKEVVA